MEIKIEKNIPLPERKKFNRNLFFPFAKMEIGDSFVIKTESLETKNIRSSIWYACKKFIFSHKKNWRFTTRKISDNKIRVWRIKDKP